MKGLVIYFDWRTSAVNAAIAKVAGFADARAHGRHTVQLGYDAPGWRDLAVVAITFLRRGYTYCFVDGWLTIEADVSLDSTDYAYSVTHDPEVKWWLEAADEQPADWIYHALDAGDLRRLLGGSDG